MVKRILVVVMLALAIPILSLAADQTGRRSSDDAGRVKAMGNWLFSPEKEQVTFYPTYGYQQGDQWVIPLRIWVHKKQEVPGRLITHLVAGLGDLPRKEKEIFQARLSEFVAIDKSQEKVRFAFDNDPENEVFQVQDETGRFPRSDRNGLIEGFINLSEARAAELLKRQESRDGWLTFRAVSKEHTGTGQVRLVGPRGLSVISDIDDTIKVTEIPAGLEVIFRNTFFRDFRAAPGMAEMYRGLGDASFHYVSGGPWQLYKPLADFLLGVGGYPAGSFHMKGIKKNPLSLDTWKDLAELAPSEATFKQKGSQMSSDTWKDLAKLARGEATFKHKVSEISNIMIRFPERNFILIGDSGEEDPGVYQHIRTVFPGQVQEIRIRDVVDARKLHPARLEGMTIIPASTIRKAESSK